MSALSATARKRRHEPDFAALPRERPSVKAELRYLGVLARRFRFSIGLVLTTLLGGTALLHHAYVLPGGEPIGWARAAQGIYFLMIGNPTLEFPSVWYLQLLFFAVPPLGVIGVINGVVQFAYLFFARQRHDKEWIEVLAETLNDHVVLCGAGRVGYRIYQALRVLGVQVLVVERREDAAFVQALRALGAPVIIEDAATAGTMARVNIEKARALVCATDDDLSNINIALDARRLKPEIRIVMRVFDEDLAGRVEGSFAVDAMSVSALAGPSFAAAALDPGVLHSFWLGGELHVLAELQVPPSLADRTVESLRQQQLLVALIERGTEKVLAPPPEAPLRAGDRVHLQGPYRAYDALAAVGRRA